MKRHPALCLLLAFLMAFSPGLTGCGPDVQIGSEDDPFSYPEYFVSGPVWVVIPFWIGAIPGTFAGFALDPLVSPFLLLVDEYTLIGMSPLERDRTHVERAFLTPPLWVAIFTGTIVAFPFYLLTLPFTPLLRDDTASIRLREGPGFSPR